MNSLREVVSKSGRRPLKRHQYSIADPKEWNDLPYRKLGQSKKLAAQHCLESREVVKSFRTFKFAVTYP